MDIPLHLKVLPDDYRAGEVGMLARWIAVGESGSVVGLPGSGRSTLLDFICQRPEVLLRHLTPGSRQVELIPVDLSLLPASDASTLYRAILRAFYWMRSRFDEPLEAEISRFYLEYLATQDPFLPQSALHELLFALRHRGIQIVLVLNHFDLFYQTAPLPLINSLRGLRNSFKETLCFLVGMFQEVAYLPDAELLGDFYELLDSHICWVGALVAQDAQYVLAQRTRTAASPPKPTEMEAMLTLAGNMPVLLKAVALWWLQNRDQAIAQWRTSLAGKRNIRHRLARLWQGLTQEEQFVLLTLRTLYAPKELGESQFPILEGLAAKGLCRLTTEGWQIQGELLAEYLDQVTLAGRGKLYLDPRTQDIYQGLTPLRQLPPQEERLLRFLLEHAYERLSYADLLDQLFGEEARDEEGRLIKRSKEDLFPLVSHLRKKIEANPAHPRHLVSCRLHQGRGYQLFPEGRPDSLPEQNLLEPRKKRGGGDHAAQD